jgi:hypothetical protein
MMTIEDMEIESPQLRAAINRFRRTSDLFFKACEPIAKEADEIRRRDETPVPALWPWDVRTPQTEQERADR